VCVCVCSAWSAEAAAVTPVVGPDGSLPPAAAAAAAAACTTTVCIVCTESMSTVKLSDWTNLVGRPSSVELAAAHVTFQCHIHCVCDLCTVNAAAADDLFHLCNY